MKNKVPVMNNLIFTQLLKRILFIHLLSLTSFLTDNPIRTLKAVWLLVGGQENIIKQLYSILKTDLIMQLGNTVVGCTQQALDSHFTINLDQLRTLYKVVTNTENCCRYS